ncbi:MAG: 1,4-alpha-glucan branching enzyme [Corynebacterium kroppenstedtii]|nr:1,4-alpha-glucan branching enzyme [Corynebacterium kroppenstedtii]
MPTIDPNDRARILAGTHYNPHSVLGAHPHDDGTTTITAFRPGAESVTVETPSETVDAVNDGDGFFTASIHGGVTDHRLHITYPDGETVTIANGYTWLPTLGEMDIHLIGEGRHERLWEVLGAHVRHYDTEMGSVDGTSFAVWAPNAQGVTVTGSFCAWNKNQFPMRSLGSSGIWEVFVPNVSAGAYYKFCVTTLDGNRIDKADPMARRAEVPPATASIVADSDYAWSDDEWMAEKPRKNLQDSPISIYEVHLESWHKGLSYTELADEWVSYVSDMGYTHVEFMPVTEYPFSGSWGYQVTSYYAPTSRFGTPDEFRALVDAFHEAGIGVIMDWVPGHFPKDEWALARFDGRACYEHPDWRRGEQKDWGTYVFDFGRAEVRNFLVANALYWVDQFHIDGLRVDAVASILYLDYSRKEGEWLPNQYGGRENLDAVQFLQEMNATVERAYPGTMTVAEESTSWPGVTAPTYDGGLGFTMWAHPGKQLLFQGQDFGQTTEWNHDESLPWGQQEGWEGEYHAAVSRLVKDLNGLYSATPALYTQDNEPSGFSWINASDAQRGVLSFMRYGSNGQRVACVFNFSGTTYPQYQPGLTNAGRWTEILNTDSSDYEGAGGGNLGQITANSGEYDGYPASATIFVPAMSALFFRFDG